MLNSVREGTNRTVAGRFATVALTAIMVLAASASPTLAAGRTLKDARGDAPAVRDILSMRTTNSTRAITTVFHVRDLRYANQLTAGLFYQARKDRWGYGIQAVAPTKKHAGHIYVWSGYNGTEDGTTVHCARATARWRFAENTLTVRLPRSCVKTTVTRVAPSAWISSYSPNIGQDSVPDPYGTRGPWIAEG